MDWERRFVEALNASRPAWDEPPRWQAALELYDSLAPAEQAELDRTVVSMIDEDYRNPHSSREAQPFDGVLVGLPAGLLPDDLLCIEAAALVAAERGLGPAYFAMGRLLRAPRWHALYPRLLWLSTASPDVQRALGLTRAGRTAGALLGLAVGERLAPVPGGGELDLADHPGRRPESEIAEVARWVAAGASGAVPCPPDDTALLTAAALANGADHPLPFGPQERAFVTALDALASGAGDSQAAPTFAAVVQAAGAGGTAVPAAGALAGARFGPHGIPRRWVLAVTGRADLEEAAERLYAAWRT